MTFTREQRYARARRDGGAAVSDWSVLHGDCLWWLRELPEASVDAVVTDPPYGIGFMGHEWDQPPGLMDERAVTKAWRFLLDTVIEGGKRAEAEMGGRPS